MFFITLAWGCSPPLPDRQESLWIWTDVQEKSKQLQCLSAPILHPLCKTRKNAQCVIAVDSCNLNVRVLSVAFTLRNASTSVAGFGISALGGSQAGGKLVMKMDQRLLLAKAAWALLAYTEISNRSDLFQLKGAKWVSRTEKKSQKEIWKENSWKLESYICNYFKILFWSC